MPIALRSLLTRCFGVLCLGLIPMAAHAAWSEATDFGAQNEASSGNGSNDSAPGSSTPYPAAGVANINTANGGSALGSGSGSQGNSSDADVYQFRILASDINNGSCNNVLKITFSNASTGGNLEIYRWDSGLSTWNSVHNYSGGNQTVYYNLSSGLQQDFYIKLGAGGCYDCNFPSAYTLNIQVVASGVLSGTVTPLALVGSNAGSITVMALGANNAPVGSTTTDAGGAYAITVPAGVAISRLSASRSWYNGAPSDWAYGPSYYALSPTVSIASSCNTLTGKDFTAYPEGRIGGTFSGPSSGNLKLSLQESYSSNNDSISGGQVEVSGGNYVLHNIPAGTYTFWGEDQSHNYAPIILPNFQVSDGLTTTANLTFSGGYTVSGSISPAGSGLTAQIRRHGETNSSVASQSSLSSSYSFSHIPAGTYDIQVGGNGPGRYIANQSVVVSGNTTSNITGLGSGGTITGSITDPLGKGTGDLVILAMRHNDSPYDVINNLAPALTTSPTGSFSPFSYSLSVDPASTYDMVLVSDFGNDFPSFWASLSNTASGATNQNMADFSGGYNITGSVTAAGIPLSQVNVSSSNEYTVVILNAAGAWRDGNHADANAGSYSSHQLLAGTYTVKMRPRYFTEFSSSATITSANVTKNITLSVDAAQDVFKPYASSLNPAQNQLVASTLPGISAVLGDGIFGTGINPSVGMSATVDSVAVSGLSYNATTHVVSFSPASTLTNGSHTVVLNFKDNASTPNTSSVTWTFTVSVTTPTRTPTRTPTLAGTLTNSPTPSPTFTASQSFTASPTFSNSPTPSPTFSFTPTPSATPTVSLTTTHTPTRTSTGTRSETFTPTRTYTATATRTATGTRSDTFTPTESSTITPTKTMTPTLTSTFSATQSHTNTPTRTATGTRSDTFTPTESSTITPTRTRTATFTHTPTVTETPTISATHTISPTFTASPPVVPFTPAGEVPIGMVGAGVLLPGMLAQIHLDPALLAQGGTLEVISGVRAIRKLSTTPGSNGLLTWDQKDEAGALVPSGDYLVVFIGNDGKIVRTRIFVVH